MGGGWWEKGDGLSGEGHEEAFFLQIGIAGGESTTATVVVVVVVGDVG